MDFIAESDRDLAFQYTERLLPGFLDALEAGFGEIGLKALTRFSYPDEHCRSVISFMVEGSGFKATVVLKGLFERLLLVDAKAMPARVDRDLEDALHVEKKTARIVTSVVAVLPCALEGLGPGQASTTLLDGALEVSLFGFGRHA